MAREWCEPECVLEHGVATDGILLLAQRVKADLIVLGIAQNITLVREFQDWGCVPGDQWQLLSGGYHSGVAPGVSPGASPFSVPALGWLR